MTEEAIREEEALIRVYQAELAILQRERSRTIEEEETNNTGGAAAAVRRDEDKEDDEDVLLLASMFPGPSLDDDNSLTTSSNGNTMATLVDLSRSKHECLELTQAIQGFVVTTVETKTKVPPTVNNAILKQPPPTAALYAVRGHFLAKPSISACIRMTVEIIDKNPESTRSKSQAKRRRVLSPTDNSTTRVASLECSLSSSSEDGDDDNVSHLETAIALMQTKSCNYIHSLPNWIQRVSAYLEFDNHQHTCLRRWNRTYLGGVYRFSRQMIIVNNSSKTVKKDVVWIQPKSETSKLPSFVWEWNWTQEKDTLQLQVVGTAGNGDNDDDENDDLSPKGLQDLVVCMGSCDMALETILRAVCPR